ncbi:MAG: hypothetical protein AAF481_17815 [Acidobacteriota bacterium]
MWSNKRHFKAIVGAFAVALLMTGGIAFADDEANGSYRDAGRDLQLGFGLGLVDPEDTESAEIYYSAALRFRIGKSYDEPVWDGDSYRGRPPADTGIRGYLEPEVSYWKGESTGIEDSDLLVGLNLIGVVPTRSADYFLGVGFGVHFLDATVDPSITGPGADLDGSEEALGGNLQVGVDVNIGENIALFGTGRIDLLEGERNEHQTKVYVGIRFKL